MISDVKRPLGSYEKLFWILGQNRAIEFALAAELEGTVSFDMWTDALDKIQEQNSLLNVSIEEITAGQAHFIWRDNAPILLRLVKDQDLGSWEKVLAEELTKPIDAAFAPLIRAVVLEEKGRSVLLLIVHHAIADGRSIAHLVKKLLEIVNGAKPSAPAPFPPDIDEVLGLTENNNSGQIYGLLAGEPGSQLGARVRSDIPSIYKLKLSSPFVKRLTNRARQEKTTVHGALTAAFVFAQKEMVLKETSRPVTVYTLASLREDFVPGVDEGMYLNSRVTSFGPENQHSFWDMARQAKDSIIDIKDPEAVKNSLQHLRKLMFGHNDLKQLKQNIAANLNWSADIILTNLGRLEYADNIPDAKLKLTTLWGPALIRHSNDSFTIGVSGVGGEISLLQTAHWSGINLLNTAGRTLLDNI